MTRKEMSKRGFGLTLAVAPMVCCLVSLPAEAQTGLLDGKVFIGEAGEKGKPADEKGDVITFAGGKFHSSLCDQWGYSKGAYTAKAEGDVIRFEAETRSEKDGRLVWSGRLKGGVMEGGFTHYRNATWYRPNPDPIEHWFKAVPKT